MDFKKIKTDFEKRYQKKCESVFFTGLPVTFFESNTGRISGCVSLGEALAVSKRDDGRITVQFSGSDKMLCFNVNEIEKSRDHRLVRTLSKLKKCGVKLGGGDIFIFKNSSITDLETPLVIGGISSFSEDAPSKEKLLPHFENYPQNLSALLGKSKSITVQDGQRTYWLPGFSGCKIVISRIGEDASIKKPKDTACMADAIVMLKRADFGGFCQLLERETERLIKGNKKGGQALLFKVAKNAGDALGSGLTEGGIFSVVEDRKVDTFIHNVLLLCRKYYGENPEFFVTDFVDSGVFIK